MITKPTPMVRADLADRLTDAGHAIARLATFWVDEGIDDDWVHSFAEFWPFAYSLDESAAELEKIAEDMRAVDNNGDYPSLGGQHAERA